MKPYLAENRSLRLATLCVLYSAQGIPDGFVKTALKTYLIDRNVSVAEIGTIIAMVSWPWSFKWVWGPFIDRYGYFPMGRRRPWILFAQGCMALALFGMLLIPDLSANARLLAGMVLAVNIFASLQDVSVDALAIDLLPDRERGAANGFMFAASFGGSYIGGRLLGALLLTSGVAAAVGTQIAILLAIALFPFLFRERVGDLLLPRRGAAARDASANIAKPSSLAQVFKMLLRAFSLQSTVLAILSLVAVNAHLVYWPAHVQRQLGWTAGDWLGLEGGWGNLCGILGSVVGGLTATAFSAKRAVILSLAAMACCWFAYAALPGQWSNPAVVSGLFMAENAVAGALQVAMWSLFMSLCWPAVAATQYTAFMAMLNVSYGLGAKLAAWFDQNFGIVNSHTALGVLQASLIVVVLLIDPSETRRKLGSGVRDVPQPELDAGLPFPPEPPR
jgi:MFS transporter, PAT family, beta-lactamase induction signal transducer AmpG